jgi:hypothetical protein
MTDDALLFIDANQYLELYRTVHGKPILAALVEQAEYIFVTGQVVDEVRRNKINVTAHFLTAHFKTLQLSTYGVHDHLFGVDEKQSSGIRLRLKDIGQKIKEVNTELHDLAMNIITKVSQSTDEVSTTLAPIFSNAVWHSRKQLQNAQQRKERGDPPGKPTDPIGDQINWEQILCQFVGKTKLWVITNDSDYGSMYGKKGEEKGFLNRFLMDELVKVSASAEVFLFDNVVDGIKHFADTMGVKADKLPSPKENENIKKEREILKEEESLPPGQQMYWMPNYRVGDYRRAAMTALGLLSSSTEGALSSVETGLAWPQTTSHEPPKEDG